MRFDVPINEILRSIKSKEINEVAIQLPEGLKRYGKEIISELEEKTDINFILSGYPCYGACDIKDEELNSLGVDKIIHLGHFEIPYSKSIKTEFFPIKSNIEINSVLEKAIKEINDKKIGVITTPQYHHRLNQIIDYLKKNNYTPVLGEGSERVGQKALVLGCDFSASRIDADTLLYIGSGEFHPLGAALANKVNVLAANPETNSVKEINYRDILKKRYAIIGKIKDMKSFGVLISSKKGQMRLNKAKKIKKTIKESSKKADLIAMDDILVNQLRNLGYDAYVNTACPRISIDDYNKFSSPMITPIEAEIAFGEKKYSDYQMDEF